MGVTVMNIGPSGSGKTTGLRNFEPGEVMVFGATGKRLPFRKDLVLRPLATYREIYDELKANRFKCYVIDDSTYLMQLDNFRRAAEKGYDKYLTMAVSFETIVEAAMATDGDTTVYFLHHPRFDEAGSTKPQTIGKMLDNQLCVEGLFDVIVESAIVDGSHVYYTNAHGIAKTPLGMFGEQVIPNDLRAVDQVIREYWGMAQLGRKANEENNDSKEA